MFLEPYKKYAVFSGRATRKEFWLFYLFYLICVSALSFIDIYAGTLWLTILFVLISFIPFYAVAFRRLHDTNRTGWWVLLLFIPIIGTIWIIVLWCFDSDPGDNRFGKNPK
jgi:uncharacterized membrane protein YhaH (DUF805 family)